MLFGDSWSASSQKPIKNGKQLIMTLWPVSKAPLRTSLSSLPISCFSNPAKLEQDSILAVFSYVPLELENQPADSFTISPEDIKIFKSYFKPEGFLHPFNLKNNRGFCFILIGNKAPILSRSRCISFQQVINVRPIVGELIYSTNLVTDLFPPLSQFSLRYPLISPPHSKSSFLPISSGYSYTEYNYFNELYNGPPNPNFSSNSNTTSTTNISTVTNDQIQIDLNKTDSEEIVKKFNSNLALNSQYQAPSLNWTKQAKLDRWKDDLTLITDFLYVSSEKVALNEIQLKNAGITHILNVASQIARSAPGFQFLGIPMNDGGAENILSHLWNAVSFIDNAKSNNGRVLVHCVEGVSRSVATIIGYLIISQRIPYAVAFNEIRRLRRIASPNPKFIGQLLQLTEILLPSQLPTCFFSKNKMVPFVISGNQVLPQSTNPENIKNGECLVLLDFRDCESLYREDSDKKGATIIISYLSNPNEVGKDSIKTALQFAKDLSNSFNIASTINKISSNNSDSNQEKDLQEKEIIYKSPNWALTNEISEGDKTHIYIVIKGRKWTVYTGEDVDDYDYDTMVQKCADANGLKFPDDYDIEGLECEDLDEDLV